MTRVIIPDTSPLGIVTKRSGVPEAEACRAWIAHCLRAEITVLMPAIAYYEILRELEQLNNSVGIARLDAFCNAVPGRYLSLSNSAVLIAAQALDLRLPSSDLIIATTNVGHLTRFLAADLWTNISA